MSISDKYSKFKNMAKPPVVEAVIDIMTEEQSIEDLNKLPLSTISETFPIREDIKSFSGKLSSENGGAAHININFIGYMHKSEIRKDIVQTRINGFAYNLLAPYKNWDEFLGNAMGFWELYREARGKTTIRQIGLRYINIFSNQSDEDIVFDIAKDVFYPQFGKIEYVNCQYQVSNQKQNCNATINMNSHPNQNSGYDVLFDIDVKRLVTMTCNKNDELTKILTDLRDFKNEIFFGNLSATQLEKF